LVRLKFGVVMAIVSFQMAGWSNENLFYFEHYSIKNKKMQ